MPDTLNSDALTPDDQFDPSPFPKTPNDGPERVFSPSKSGSHSVIGASGAGMSEVLDMTFDWDDLRFEFSGNQDIDAALIGSRWTPTNLTYSFPTSGAFYNTPYYDPTYVAEQLPFNAAQQTAAIYAFNLISSYTNLTFTQVTEDATTHGTIRLSQTTADNEQSAEANFPGDDPSDGDIWFGQTNQPFYLTPAPGNWGQATMMHEIGHAMGLKHGHQNYTYEDLVGYVGNTPGRGGSAALPSWHDGQAWSLMTYRSDPNNLITFQGDQFNQPQTYMQDDIAALQYLYGANFTTNSTDSVYTFSDTTGEMFINGVGQGAPQGNVILRTVWDGGGNDTYDFSNSNADHVIDLTPGGWSTFTEDQLANHRAYSHGLAVAPGNIANALLYEGDTHSLIENAIGGNGDDVLIGNQAVNHLTGNGGNDYMDGGEGADVMIGGQGDDTYVIDDAGDVATELADGGNDTLVTLFTTTLQGSNFENVFLYGSDNVDATGTDGDNMLGGNDGLNVLTGGDGNDTYFVQNAGDTIVELANQGTDTVVASLDYDLTGTELENLTLSGRDDLNGTGNSVANRIIGNGGNNLLIGGSGNDDLSGGVDVRPDPVYDSGLAVHDTIATALAIGAESFSKMSDPNIVSSTTAPHASIIGDGSGTRMMYSFDVSAAGVIGAFDIDFTNNLDSVLRLYDSSGALLKSNDDAATSNGAGGSVQQSDSYMTFSFAAAGTYYIEVSNWFNNDAHYTLPQDSAYLLNVSLLNNAFDPGNADTLNGGTGNDHLDGGSGLDTAVFSGLQADYEITATASGFTIFDLRGAAGDGTDQLISVEQLQFSDVLVTSIAATNQVPSLTGPQATLTGNEDTPYIINLADLVVGYTDADGDTITASSVTSNIGTVVDNGNGTVTLTTPLNYNGPVTLSYQLTDGLGVFVNATAPVTIAPVNDAPTGTNDTATVLAAGPRTITLTAASLLSNDQDIDGDVLHITGVGSAAHGTVVLNDNGTAGDFSDDFVTYSPAIGYTGPDSFNYTLSDGTASASATVNITVQTASAMYTTGGSGDDVINKTGQSNPQLISGQGGNDTLTGGLAGDTLNGGDGNDILNGGQFADVLTGGNGADQFYIDKADMASGVDKITDFQGAGNGAVAGDDRILLSGFSAAATVSLLSNNGTAHTYKVTDGAFTGTFIAVYAGNATLVTGDYAFTPPPATVSHSPVAGGDSATVLASGPRTITLTAASLLTNDSDADGDALRITGITSAGHGTVVFSDNGTAGNTADDYITYTPTGGYAGSDTFNYVLSDGTTTSLGVVSLTVQAATATGPVYTSGNAAANTYDFSGSSAIQLVNGQGGNDVITTGSANDTLNGGADNDVLNGGTGKDTLTGGTGLDTFVFTSADNDKIVDFSVADDTFALSKGAFAAIDEQNASDHILLASQFVIGSAATTADQHVVYNAATGGLYYDADGNGVGAMVQIATLTKNLALTHDDFVVWA